MRKRRETFISQWWWLYTCDLSPSMQEKNALLSMSQSTHFTYDIRIYCFSEQGEKISRQVKVTPSYSRVHVHELTVLKVTRVNFSVKIVANEFHELIYRAHTNSEKRRRHERKGKMRKERENHACIDSLMKRQSRWQVYRDARCTGYQFSVNWTHCQRVRVKKEKKTTGESEMTG